MTLTKLSFPAVPALPAMPLPASASTSMPLADWYLNQVRLFQDIEIELLAYSKFWIWIAC